MYHCAISLPHNAPIAIPIDRKGPKANFDSPEIILLIIPTIAEMTIPINAETITACVPRYAPAEIISRVSPNSIARKSSPNFFFMKLRLTSPIIKNGTLIIKAPVIL